MKSWGGGGSSDEVSITKLAIAKLISILRYHEFMKQSRMMVANIESGLRILSNIHFLQLTNESVWLIVLPINHLMKLSMWLTCWLR
ncbi:UNVERIFIED_ORG: hypothetical protein ABIC97_002076 [Peribacillus simplex]